MIDFTKNLSIKGSEAQNQRPDELLGMLRFDGKSISIVDSLKLSLNLCLLKVHPRLDIVNEPIRPLLFTISSHLLYQGKVFLLNPIKGAGFCLLYQGFYYIEVYYIESRVYYICT